MHFNIKTFVEFLIFDKISEHKLLFYIPLNKSGLDSTLLDKGYTRRQRYAFIE